jgi:hypothetical protein
VRLRKPLNCLRVTISQIFDGTLSIESGRLFEATSWSPSFKSGIISAIFQDSGKVEVVYELLINLGKEVKIWKKKLNIVDLQCLKKKASVVQDQLEAQLAAVSSVASSKRRLQM